MSWLNEHARVLWFFGVLALMGVAESFWRAREWETPRWRRWRFHLGVSVFNTVLTRLVAGAPLYGALAFVESRSWGVARWLGLKGVWEIAVTLVFFDALDYWWHRFNHRVPFLWNFHRLHHADTHVDVTTSLRFHPGELLLSSAVKFFWILFWGPSAVSFMIFEAAITGYAQFHHSNMDFPDAVESGLRWFHMTPRLHASHHTETLRTRDANFSTIFLLWDRIFGTLREPDREEMKRLGLPEARERYLDWREFMTAPLRPLPASGKGGDV
ncbi:MAG: sterol desaturase family protein [Candidatus Omnitrophica bacterium]|nr:sterol desaturase family protein [Candidatus Omnitrophota bacterium]